MKKLHFYKAKSRLGMKNPPWGFSEPNIGVEEAPDSILTESFLAQLPGYKITEIDFPSPEDLKSSEFNKILADRYREFKNQINSTLGEDEVQVTIGGDHSVTFGSAPALLERVSETGQVGYLQIDSHPDILLYRESSTHNFHGMYFRALISDFDVEEIDRVSIRKLLPQNVWFIGNIDFEGPEENTFVGFGIKNTRRDTILKNPSLFAKDLQDFIDLYPYLHLSLDVDGLHKSIAPATGIPAEDGLMLDELNPILDIVFKHPNLSFDLVEVNPRRPGADQTIKLAQDIIKKLANS